MTTNWLKKNLIAHRGLYDNKILENSLLSFNLAIEKKYIIELDVRLSKDNKVVVYHDNNFNRLFNIKKEVKDLTLNEIKTISSDICTLEETLNFVNGKVPLLIEIKTNNINTIKETMNLLKYYKGRYAIQSFSPLILYWLKKHYNNVLRGQLACDFDFRDMGRIKSFLLKTMTFNIFTKPHFISYNYKDLSTNQIKLIKKDYILLGWTVKDKNTYLKIKDKFDNLICEKFI